MTLRFPQTDGERPHDLVDLQLVVRAAQGELTRRARLGAWERSFRDAIAMDPLLVLAPVGDPGNFFIVDFRIRGKSTARIIYRATDARLVEIAGLSDTKSELTPFFRPVELPDVLRGAPIAFPRGRSESFGNDPVTIEKDLVWAPCDQSLTPLEPFYVVGVRRTTVYVRVDGKAFGELTEFAAGG